MRGSDHSNAKLTESKVVKIRAKHRSGIGYDRLARLYGVSKTAIQRIVLRRTWAHVQEQQPQAAE